MVKMNNKTVLVTGASSGIGLELSKIFVRNNYDLVMISQNEENLNKARNVISRENNSAKIYTITKDLSDAAAASDIYEYTRSKQINIDILVNNAGIQVYGNFHEVSEDEIIKLMYVNMYTVTCLTRKYVDDMVKRGEGKVLNIASTGAFQACPLNAAYCASKSYVLHLSEAIGEELKGTGVSVTTLCPGATNTNFAKRANIEDIKLFKGKLLNAAKVAAIGYNALISNKSVAITGLSNMLMAESVRFMPRWLITKVGMNIMKK
jgi:short-subunit dehydrogenase